MEREFFTHLHEINIEILKMLNDDDLYNVCGTDQYAYNLCKSDRILRNRMRNIIIRKNRGRNMPIGLRIGEIEKDILISYEPKTIKFFI